MDRRQRGQLGSCSPQPRGLAPSRSCNLRVLATTPWFKYRPVRAISSPPSTQTKQARTDPQSSGSRHRPQPPHTRGPNRRPRGLPHATPQVASPGPWQRLRTGNRGSLGDPRAEHRLQNRPLTHRSRLAAASTLLREPMATRKRHFRASSAEINRSPQQHGAAVRGGAGDSVM